MNTIQVYKMFIGLIGMFSSLSHYRSLQIKQEAANGCNYFRVGALSTLGGDKCPILNTSCFLFQCQSADIGLH